MGNSVARSRRFFWSVESGRDLDSNDVLVKCCLASRVNPVISRSLNTANGHAKRIQRLPNLSKITEHHKKCLSSKVIQRLLNSSAEFPRFDDVWSLPKTTRRLSKVTWRVISTRCSILPTSVCNVPLICFPFQVCFFQFKWYACEPTRWS